MEQGEIEFFLSKALLPFLEFSRFISFLILYLVGRTPLTGDQSVARALPTHRTTQTQNKLTQISNTRVGFESTIPVFERAKTAHALDRAATVIGEKSRYIYERKERNKGVKDESKEEIIPR
jgi:hypothetical protein